MRRGQLGRRIEYYSHPKYGGHVPIYLDAGKCLFSGVIGDVTLQHENLAALRKLVDEALKNQHSLEWIPVIEISFGYSWSRGEEKRNGSNKETSLNFKRYWIAKKIDGRWIEADWDVESWPTGARKKKIEVGDRLERSKTFKLSVWSKGTHEYEDIKDLKLPYTKKREDREESPTYFIPYTKLLWSALLDLAVRMDDLQFKLVKILGSVEGRAQLVESAARLLPAAAKV